MFGKIIAGIVMGVIVALLSFLVFGIGSGGGERGGSVGGWAALAGFALTLILAIRAERDRYAWGRGMLLAALLCLAMPIASVALTGLVGAQQVGTATTEAAKAGAAIGTALGGGMLTIFTGFVGFFLALIFLIGSYFTLRKEAPAIHPSSPPLAATGFLGSCPKCGALRHSKAPFCSSCNSAEPVVSGPPKGVAT